MNFPITLLHNLFSSFLIKFINSLTIPLLGELKRMHKMEENSIDTIQFLSGHNEG